MTMRQQTLYAFTLCTLVMLTGCGEQAPCGITVRDAWIREPPPRSPAAGYLVIENNCAVPVALVGAATASAARTEIHVMETRNGRMTMDRVDSLNIAAGASLKLKSGGSHLMLLQLLQPLKAGDEVELALSFGDGAEHRVVAPVRKDPGYAGG